MQLGSFCCPSPQWGEGGSCVQGPLLAPGHAHEFSGGTSGQSMGVPPTCTAIPVPEVQTQADQLQHPVSGYMWMAMEPGPGAWTQWHQDRGARGTMTTPAWKWGETKRWLQTPCGGAAVAVFLKWERGRHRGGYSQGGSVRWSPGSSVSWSQCLQGQWRSSMAKAVGVHSSSKSFWVSPGQWWKLLESSCSSFPG